MRNLGGLQGLAQKLHTSLDHGITGDQSDINLRRQVFGSNQSPPPKTKSLLSLIAECFEDPMLKLLLLAAFVSLVIGVINDGWDNGWIEGSSIFLAVGIITTVTASNNYVKDKQF
jgi:P-type Ca2+ transporter type 2B